MEDLRAQVAKQSVEDLVGFSPKDNQCPFTPIFHCPNCGHSNTKAKWKEERVFTTTKEVEGQVICQNCRSELKSKVDYGSLTDAVVWGFVFHTLDLELGTEGGGFTDVLSVLPKARSYFALHELGKDFFNLQCYFITHFIYVMSDWGRSRLRKELYWEEYQFLVNNLACVASTMHDPELVGEFLHCLRILGMDTRVSKEWAAMVASGEAMLGVQEHVLGLKGRFVRSPNVYTKYHSAWTG